MKKNLRDSFKEIDEFFKSPLTANQKAWGIIHDFIHVIMTKMKVDEISQTELADRLGVSRARISQILNNAPNMTIKTMVEVAEAAGINIHLNREKAELDISIQKEREYFIIEVNTFIPPETVTGKFEARLVEFPSGIKRVESILEENLPEAITYKTSESAELWGYA